MTQCSLQYLGTINRRAIIGKGTVILMSAVVLLNFHHLIQLIGNLMNITAVWRKYLEFLLTLCCEFPSHSSPYNCNYLTLTVLYVPRIIKELEKKLNISHADYFIYNYDKSPLCMVYYAAHLNNTSKHRLFCCAINSSHLAYKFLK